ncbi:trehalose utilization protein [bacterium]|nr:trehalose utilization protein [bacterium]
MLRFLIAPVALWFAMVSTASAAEPRNVVRVRVWDERQPEQKKAYDGGFLGDAIARHLQKHAGFEVKSVALDDSDQGLSDAALDQTDVLIWWGHVRHDAVKVDRVKAVVDRVMAGKLSLIALHSAHFARPFMSLMHERSKADALKMMPEADRRAGKFDFSRPLKREMVKPDSPLTPRLEKQGETWVLIPPVCVFPSWRADAAPGHVTTLLPDHPIAAGLPKTWDVRQTEMYSEPFHVPPPDAVIFEEKWDKGERFRSGCLWTVGKGLVFYFRPGHETYPVFEQAEVIKVLENAVKFIAMK